MSFGKYDCLNCKISFLKPIGYLNEKKELVNNSYCSQFCQSAHRFKRVTLVCSNCECKREFSRKLSAISPRNYCSHSCAAIVMHRYKVKVLRSLDKCKFCEKNIQRKGCGYCSRQCYMSSRVKYWQAYKPRYSPEDVLLVIRKFINKNGRLPVKRELNKIYQPARKYYGSWNNAIEAAGFMPNPVLFANHHIARDGHICDSLAEKIIDDYLCTVKIKHERSVHYPEGTYTADFKIGEKYVEYFGLAGEHKRYDELRRIKLKLANKYKMNLIEIYPKDLFPNHKLAEIIW